MFSSYKKTSEAIENAQTKNVDSENLSSQFFLPMSICTWSQDTRVTSIQKDKYCWARILNDEEEDSKSHGRGHSAAPHSYFFLCVPVDEEQ